MMLEIKVKPGTPGAARVEYYACREEVEAMLAKGYNARNVYDHLKSQGRVTCSYSALCDYVRGGGKRRHSKKRKPLPSLSTPANIQREGRGPIIVSQESKKLLDPRTIDPAILF